MRTAKALPAHDSEAAGLHTDATVEMPCSWEIFSVICPECGQPIALLADEETLPQHARCPTRHHPFGPAVCSGSGQDASKASRPTESEYRDEDVTALLTLPEGLHWRTQPFSHAAS